MESVGGESVWVTVGKDLLSYTMGAGRWIGKERCDSHNICPIVSPRAGRDCSYFLVERERARKSQLFVDRFVDVEG